MDSDGKRFRIVHDLGRAFATRHELDELLPIVVERCREVLDAEGVSVLLLDREHNELYFPYFSQNNPEVTGRLAKARFPADQGIAGAVLQSGRSEKLDNVGADPRHYGGVDEKTGITTRSMLAVALKCGEEKLGVIEAINHRGATPFTDEDLVLLETLAESIADAVENVQRFAEVKAAEQRLRVELGALRRDLARRDTFPQIVGASPAMLEVFRLMESAAASSIAVLIEGETGTGKELVARAIHNAGARADRPFLAVNCAAFTETLLESELFGHRRGAFTGATSDQLGLFRAATGGTVFLDEIGEMPFAMQAKLLRVLQEGEVTPIGDTRAQKVDVRVLSATNRDLKAAVAAHSFREDLYYRLAAFPIRLPALRERPGDLPLLAALFLHAAAERAGKQIAGFEPQTLAALSRYEWPGNIRQLQNEIERAVALAKAGEAIAPAHLSPAVTRDGGEIAPHRERASSFGEQHGGAVAPPSEPGSPAGGTLREAAAAFEASYIRDVLARHQRNVSRTAKTLGVSRVTLQKKMKEYGLR